MADELDSEDLRLNTLNRFRKHSPRLLLEEYSHCEVPAGCGGVVLRWVDPKTAMPSVASLVAPEGREPELFVDGEAVLSGRIDVAPGPHLLAIDMGLGGAGSLLFSIVRELARDDPSRDPSVIALVSQPGSPWRQLSGERPRDGWTRPEFDDRAWDSPSAGDDPASNWMVDRLRERGARPIAIPAGRCWLRAPFVVQPLAPPATMALAVPEPRE